MHRNIIKARRIKPNDKGLTSLEKRPVKPPIIKMQQVFHVKSVCDELELVMEITTSSRTSHGYNPNKNQES
jgi:hypothetical protein